VTGAVLEPSGLDMDHADEADAADGSPRLRVLIANDFFHPTIGGAEHQVRLLAAALARRGHQVAVATVRQPGQEPTAVVDGVDIHRLPALSTGLAMASSEAKRRFLPPLPDPRLVLGLRSLLGDLGGVDVVHAGGWIAYSCAAALEGRDEPMLLSVRDYGYSCAVRSLLHQGKAICSGPALGKCLDCAGRHYGAPKALAAVGGVFTGRPLLARHVSGIHSVSRFVQSIVERDLLHDDPGWQPILERIPDIVPDAAASNLGPGHEAYLQLLPPEPFILFVGVLQRHKGVQVLLEAYERLQRMPGRTPALVLIGSRHEDTPERFPAGVSVLNDVPHPAVMAAWQRSLFGVAPSIWPDPLPGVVREPMSRGRPVVATEVGGNTDMVTNGHNGLLVPPGDAEALALAMRRLLDDDVLRTTMGETAKASVAGLTADGVASRFEDLYARLVRVR
jgi:glycosyltransferase involved in cell wall biosynthesis